MADLRLGRVTALMTCLNGEPFVESAVDSLLNQSREADEVVLFDNASLDGTRAVFERAARHHPRVRLRSASQPLSAAASMAKALEYCRTEFVAFFHADDVSRPDRLELQLAAASENIAVVGAFLEEVDENLNPLGVINYPENYEEIYSELFSRNVVALPAALVRMTAIQSVGGIRTEASYAADYDLWLRVAEAGFHFKTVPETLVKYRRHRNQDSAGNDVQLLWGKFNALLSSAFRIRLGQDPFAQNPRLWGSYPVDMLQSLVPSCGEEIAQLTDLLKKANLSWREHKRTRDAALQVLRCARPADALG